MICKGKVCAAGVAMGLLPIACAILALPGLARAGWSSPETIALPSGSTGTADVLLRTNPAGDAVLSWKEGSNVVRASVRPAGGPFGASGLLDSNTGAAAPVPRLGIGPDGRAVVMWFSNNGGRKLRYADRAAGAAAFGSAQDVFAPSEDIGGLDVVVDTQGATHAAFDGPGFNQYRRVWATDRSSSGGAFAAPASITGNLTPGAPGQIVLATATNGQSALTYYSPTAEYAPGSQQQVIEGGVRAAGDAAWSFAPSGGNQWFCCYSMGPQGVSRLAMDGSGRSYFVVHGVNDAADPPSARKPGPNFVLVGAGGTVAQGRQQLDPTWSNAGIGGTNGGDPQIAVDPSGNAWAAWAKEVSGTVRLFTAFRPAGVASSFGPGVEAASDLAPSFGGAFRLSADPAGAVLVWRGGCSAGACTLESKRAGAASGQFADPETVATGVYDDGGLQLAALPGSQALAVYRIKDGNLEARRFSRPAAPGGSGPEAPGGSGPDQTPPSVTLSGKSTQKLGKAISVTVACPTEACTASASGTLSVPRAARAYRLGQASASIRRGGTATLRLKLRSSARRAARKALRRRKRVRATVAVTVRDGAGNSASRKRVIKLKR